MDWAIFITFAVLWVALCWWFEARAAERRAGRAMEARRQRAISWMQWKSANRPTDPALAAKWDAWVEWADGDQWRDAIMSGEPLPINRIRRKAKD